MSELYIYQNARCNDKKLLKTGCRTEGRTYHRTTAALPEPPVLRVTVKKSSYLISVSTPVCWTSFVLESRWKWNFKFPLSPSTFFFFAVQLAVPEGSRKLSYPDFMTTAQEGGKVVSLTHRPHLPPGNSLGTHFC